MVQLSEFCAYCDEYLDSKAIKDYCPNGLQVEGCEEVHSFATAVSASLETIQKAADARVQLLLVHHGMFWDKDPYEVVGVRKKKLQLLLDNQISLVSYHLPLDIHHELGNNWKAAMDLGWRGLEPLIPYGNHDLGVKGSFPEQTVEEFKEKIEAYYQHPAHCCLGGKEKVSTGALISGGAYKYIEEAAKAGVDLFITGNFDEPAWHMAREEKIHFFAMGHSATEVVGPKAFGEHLAEKFSIETLFIDVPNPF